VQSSFYLFFVTLKIELHRLDAELSLQQQEWDKQEKILQTLRQKSDSRQLSPELANSVLPINQHVQALLNGRLRALDLRWDFSQHTLLHLSLQGYFVDLQQFLTALLNDVPTLSLTQLNIKKLDEEENASITCELIFHRIPKGGPPPPAGVGLRVFGAETGGGTPIGSATYCGSRAIW